MRVFMLTAGILLILSSLRMLRRARSFPTLLYLASLFSGGCGMIVWAPDNSRAVDDLVHISGASHLLTIWLIGVCFFLQFAFVTSLSMRPARYHLRGSALFGGLLGIFTLAWLAVRLTEKASFDTLSFGSYAGGSPAVVAMDVGGGLTVTVAALLGAWGYVRFLAEGRRLDERLSAFGALSVLVGGAAYGCIALANTAAHGMGRGDVGLFAARVPIILTSAALAPITVWLVIQLQPLWQRLLALRASDDDTRLRQREEELFQLRLDLLDAQTMLDDATARLRHFADPAVVDAVARRCSRSNLSPYAQRVAIEAAIWTTAMRTGAGWIPWIGGEHLASAGETDEADQLHAEAERAHHFTADTFRVVLLVCGHTRLPDGIAPRSEAPGWRRRAAAVVRLALREQGYARTDIFPQRTWKGIA